MPLMDRTVERLQESIGKREGSGISKGPRDGNRTRVAVSTMEHNHGVFLIFV